MAGPWVYRTNSFVTPSSSYYVVVRLRGDSSQDVFYTVLLDSRSNFTTRCHPHPHPQHPPTCLRRKLVNDVFTEDGGL